MTRCAKSCIVNEVFRHRHLQRIYDSAIQIGVGHEKTDDIHSGRRTFRRHALSDERVCGDDNSGDRKSKHAETDLYAGSHIGSAD